MRRVFVDWIEGDRAGVGGARAHHLARVVRLRPGERVEASDFRRAFEAVAEAVEPKEVLFRLGTELPPEPPEPAIELHLAIVKYARWEWALEKATELGVATVVPLAAERSDEGLVRAAAKRVERWRAIAEEAAQQSRRLAPPELTEPLNVAQALARPAESRWLVDFGGAPIGGLGGEAAGRHVVAVGPEGGWSDRERAAFASAGARAVSLGPRVLRTETAAVVGVAVRLASE